jgi:hypothetical protein
MNGYISLYHKVVPFARGKSVQGSVGRAALILNFGARWGFEVNFTPSPFRRPLLSIKDSVGPIE